jgi:peptide/nickel transport system substrate-binding protein
MPRKRTRLTLVALPALLLTALVACAPAAPAGPTAAPAKPAESKPAATTAPAKPAAAPTTAPAAKPAEAKPAASPAAQPAAKPAAKPAAGRVTIAIGAEPSTLDPQVTDDGNMRAVNDNIYEGLTDRDKDNKLIGRLAEKWEQTNPTTWRFTLRKGVQFHNGEPFNAQAVAHSVKRIIDPKLNSGLLSYYGDLSDARVVDESTVDLITKAPDPILPVRMYFLAIVPVQASSAADFAEKPVGTGPYKFVEWRRGQQVTLVANDAYWGGTPGIKDVVIRTIPEAATRLAALRAGEVDLVRGLLPEQTGQAPKVERIDGVEFPTIRLNQKTGPLTDPRVRQAMNYAVDKQALAQALFGGFASVAQGQLLQPSYIGFNPQLQPYPYDPNRAQDLLRQAGVTNVEFDLISESGRWLKDRELTEAVAGQLEKVGFRPKVTFLEFSKWIDSLFAQQNQPHAIFTSHSNELFDADRTVANFLLCEGRSASYCKGAEFDKLINDARTELDAAKRQQMYNQILKTAYDDPAFIYLLNVQDIYGLTQKLQWKPRTDGGIRAWEMTLSQ